VVELFLNSLVKDYGKHSLFHRWGGTWYSYMLVNSWEDRTLYIYSTYMRKALLRENNPIHQKDRTESVFDDYFSCSRKDNCKLNHIKNWLKLFIDIQNKK
jgi:hypothetical protein